MDIEKINQYELGYHLLPDLNEEEVRTTVNLIEEIISKSSGNIISAQEPKRTSLAYPIKHKFSSYFGTIEFNSMTEEIDNIVKALKLNENILRHLVITKTKQRAKERMTAYNIANRQQRVKSITAGKKKTEKEIPSKELEKQIEDIIKKI